jgi:hypothetical protein
MDGRASSTIFGGARTRRETANLKKLASVCAVIQALTFLGRQKTSLRRFADLSGHVDPMDNQYGAYRDLRLAGTNSPERTWQPTDQLSFWVAVIWAMSVRHSDMPAIQMGFSNYRLHFPIHGGAVPSLTTRVPLRQVAEQPCFGRPPVALHRFLRNL